jgi:hypothetical protein
MNRVHLVTLPNARLAKDRRTGRSGWLPHTRLFRESVHRQISIGLVLGYHKDFSDV